MGRWVYPRRTDGPVLVARIAQGDEFFPKACGWHGKVGPWGRGTGGMVRGRDRGFREDGTSKVANFVMFGVTRALGDLGFRF